jgi:uncharacterized protein YdeI (YjbR/CyaY-like superfamily)
MTSASDPPIIAFPSPQEWESWLAKNHGTSRGIWLRFFKKGSVEATVTYPEALDVALSYGWIDGQSKGLDDLSWIQRFTPRRPKSVWSKINTQRVEGLIKEGKMKAAGLKEVEAAKADGRWDKAYDSPSSMAIPEDFLKELARNKKAEAFFKTLNKTNTYAIAWRLQTAKRPETRARRMSQILAMLAEGRKLHG